MVRLASALALALCAGPLSAGENLWLWTAPKSEGPSCSLWMWHAGIDMPGCGNGQSQCGCAPGCTCPSKEQCPCKTPLANSVCYAEGRSRAVKQGCPLVVFVNQPARSVPGCVVAHAAGTVGAVKFDGPCVLVGRKGGSYDLERFDLPGRPTDAEILGKAFPRPAFTSPPPAPVTFYGPVITAEFCPGGT